MKCCRRMAAVQSVLKKTGSSNQKSGSRYLFSASLAHDIIPRCNLLDKSL
jgi:hypothetical protein